MTHRSALLLVILATLLWSMAGVVSRWLHATKGFEMVFWRSSAATVVVLVLLLASGDRAPFSRLREAGASLWVSGLCWAVMFTCFMISLTLTSVANVLIMQSLGPVFTALMVRLVLKRALPVHSWLAMLLAALGVAIMYVGDVGALDNSHLLGMLVALCIPLTSAVNLIVLQRVGKAIDLRGAVMVGALLSALVMLPLALPARADAHDILWLAFLGTFQLAIPCVLLVIAARMIAAHELALLALLEVIFGVTWAWLFAGEAPGALTLIGGGVVLAVLAAHELLSVHVARRKSKALTLQATSPSR